MKKREQVNNLKVGEKIEFEHSELKKYRLLVKKGLLIIAIPDGKYKIERIY
jgi:hypothetical protein